MGYEFPTSTLEGVLLLWGHYTILGHFSLETTRIYEHLNERDLKRKMEKLVL